ncbi:hypothetical protein RSAG8_02266, partial [Rhizoctonia solani AG-8 WAC10335]
MQTQVPDVPAPYCIPDPFITRKRNSIPAALALLILLGRWFPYRRVVVCRFRDPPLRRPAFCA